MKNILLASAALVCAAFSSAAGERGIFGLYGDTPDAKHAWAVHDFNRPYPKQVETPPGKPPSDAIVLFDGTLKGFHVLVRNKVIGAGDYPLRATLEAFSRKNEHPAT